jgi:hypothetical protein
MGHLIAGPNDEIFEGILPIQRNANLLKFPIGTPQMPVLVPIHSSSGWTPRPSITLHFERNGDIVAGLQSQALCHHIEVIFLQPYGGEVIGYAENYSAGGFLDDIEWLKPGAKNISRKLFTKAGANGIP